MCGKIVKKFFTGSRGISFLRIHPSEKSIKKGLFIHNTGQTTLTAAFSDDLLSHSVPQAVPSARKGLTTVVGMATGGPPSL